MVQKTCVNEQLTCRLLKLRLVTALTGLLVVTWLVEGCWGWPSGGNRDVCRRRPWLNRDGAGMVCSCIELVSQKPEVWASSGYLCALQRCCRYVEYFSGRMVQAQKTQHATTPPPRPLMYPPYPCTSPLCPPDKPLDACGACAWPRTPGAWAQAGPLGPVCGFIQLGGVV